MNIYLIRHARQDSKLCNVNVPLSQEGIKQAKLLAKRLEAYPLDALYSSDLIRAMETAQIINEYHHLNHQVEENLEEIDFGAMTGNTDEFNAKEYADFLTEYRKMEQDLCYPGGECGAEVYKRVKPILEDIVATGKEEVAIVTHGGVIRAILVGILNMGQEKRSIFAPTLENTGITQLYYDRLEQRFFLQRLNDCAHLEGYPELMRGTWK